MGSTKVTDEKLARTIAREVEWFKEPRPVWVWVQWRDRPAERLPGWAVGANDRVVMITVDVGGDHWEPVVWRNAVTVRAP